MTAARYMPELQFSTMVQTAERYVRILPNHWTLICSFKECGTELWLRRYWCDFEDLQIFNRGRAALCPACMTFYYSDEPVKVKAAAE